MEITGMLAVGNGEKCPFCDEILDDRIKEGMIDAHLFGKHKEKVMAQLGVKS